MSDAVLVLRALGLGDLLVAVPALRGLRRAHPDARTVLAAPHQLTEVVELIDAVDELLPTPGLGALHWPGEPPEVAVNLHGRGPESIRDLRATRPGTLLTHRHPDFPDLPGPEWVEDQHEVRRWCRLLEHFGIAADPADLHLPAPPGPSPAPGAVVVHPGAAQPARRWPAERFAGVARALAAAGHRVVVTGNAAEADLARDVARRAGLPEDVVLAGRLGLAELVALLARATLLVAADTGVGHLATAMRTPSVLLFGPVSPRQWGPPEGERRHVALWAGEPADPFADAPAPGLLRLTEDDVLAAVRQLAEEGLLARRDGRE
ncbi:ADP-heptose:LPS heptosyltransferase [Amycolatopsis arida]|uniref:ADP-heptose:LPS heptosyltransferase n=1 Tax=Amycolatopsis arida TaxID=587909 RepID=A0A1I5XGP4_9PSEU|nr:glycosyltransferase family 9 protein [Amycolatopsis arida]TDX97464.1 ADP-heptose:LPS heptosyltransferase [Amycolatopsis arida]SFQ31129.1 ADP-heptose:LPS heptosyltransferase [Amycolatopsis arida]